MIINYSSTSIKAVNTRSFAYHNNTLALLAAAFAGKTHQIAADQLNTNKVARNKTRKGKNESFYMLSTLAEKR
jgi:hypothetical protein